MEALPRGWENGIPIGDCAVAALDDVSPGDPLDTVVSALANSADLEQWLADRPHVADEIFRRAQTCIGAAFDARDEAALLIVHRSLKILYDLHLFYNRAGAENQHNPFLNQIRQAAEAAWMTFERARSSGLGRPVPDDEQAFCAAFRDYVLAHPAARHPIYDFLRSEASAQQLNEYFLSDCLLNVRFFDIIVLAALGTTGGIRQEVSQNLWDESGAGAASQAHTTLFRSLIERLGITYEDDDFLNRGHWQTLAGYNLFLYLAIHRKNYYLSIGSLAATELLDPPQYAKLIDGCKRLGIDRATDLTYYTEHITVDIKHGDGWISNVMRPLLMHRGAREHFVFGAEMRLNTCLDYYNWLSARLCGKTT